MYKQQKMCDCCKVRPATYVHKEYINGQLLNIALCDECQSNLNIAEHYNVFLSSIFDDFFNPVGYESEVRQKKVCKCGCTEEDILNTGRFGCSECYKTFSNLVSAYVNKLGGKTYAGKMPQYVMTKTAMAKNTVPSLSIDQKIELLKQKMNEAAKKENYSLAQQYKREIQELMAKRG